MGSAFDGAGAATCGALGACRRSARRRGHRFTLQLAGQHERRLLGLVGRRVAQELRGVELELTHHVGAVCFSIAGPLISTSLMAQPAKRRVAAERVRTRRAWSPWAISS